MTTVLSRADGEALAERTLAANALAHDRSDLTTDRLAADRERVVSDLDGLRDALDGLRAHSNCGRAVAGRWASDCIAYYRDCQDRQRHQRAAERASAGLLRTAALYGVTP